ncbi:cell wall-associated NlpC family hydrolase [Weissella uvarum]|uniref:hypothetical protein n=1 Tax=Weissella uvarum TaxID=1479233 RepID=UPI00195FAC37|nr:hypothetical protein [Weissella uvarum]MBM7617744.1 cell wall-associated NlpC family hydrolase [Weissella uvarum]MCM0595877.1 hypothetical protein [Weissella uvarum]
MGKKRNTIVVSGMIGALGVMGATQVPEVKAAMQHFEQAEKSTSQQVVQTDPVHQSLQKLMGQDQPEKQSAAKKAEPKRTKSDLKQVSAKKSDAVKQAQQAATVASSQAVQTETAKSQSAEAKSQAAVSQTMVAQATDTQAITEAATSQEPAIDQTVVTSESATSQVTSAVDSNVNQTVSESASAAIIPSESAAISESAVSSLAPAASEQTVTSDATSQAVSPDSTTGAVEQSAVATDTQQQGNAMTDAATEVVNNGTATTSGQLVAQSYQAATGRTIPANTTEQEAYFATTDVNGQPVDAVAQPGDVLFWGDHGTAYQSGVYFGDNQVATVADQTATAAVQPIQQSPDFVGTYQ